VLPTVPVSVRDLVRPVEDGREIRPGLPAALPPPASADRPLRVPPGRAEPGELARPRGPAMESRVTPPRLVSVWFGSNERYQRMAAVLAYTAAKHCPSWDVQIERMTAPPISWAHPM